MLVHKINKICLCSNYIVKFLQMLFKKKKSNSKVKKKTNKQEKKERDTFRNWDSTLKLTISYLPLLKMYTTINVIALAFFKNSRWKNGQFVFFFSSKCHCYKSLFFISNRVKNKTKKQNPVESQPEMKCSQKPHHVQMAEVHHCHTTSQSMNIIHTGYPVLTQ